VPGRVIVLVGLTRWGQQLLGEKPSWGEVRQSWGWTLIQAVTEVRGWLATLGRLILWGFQTLCPLSIPQLAGGHLDFVKDL
jgi:hypothetical protein